jgi:hypothetical protein
LNSIDTYTTESFTRFLKIEQQYPDNYCGQLLKLLKIILHNAKKSGLEVHPYSNYIESFKQKSSDLILHILNQKEIKVLKELQHVPAAYTNSYNWLLIGLCIGQRVSDNLKLSPDTLRKAPTGLYIDILQQKTKKAGTVGVADPLVIELLKNEFPRRVSQVVFHKQIKALCKMAGINELISRFKNNPKTRRKKIVNTPKYKFVTHLLCDVLLHLTIMVKLKHRCL